MKTINLQTYLLTDLTCDVKSLSQEIPDDELEIGKDELLVPVAHFNKVRVTLVFSFLRSVNYWFLLSCLIFHPYFEHF